MSRLIDETLASSATANDPNKLERLVAAGQTTEPMPSGELHDGLIILHALKVAREALGLSLTDIEAISGMDRAQISKLENGRSNPTVATLARYAAAIGRPIEMVLGPHAPCDRCGKTDFRFSHRVDDMAVFECQGCQLLLKTPQIRCRSAQVKA